MLRNQLFTKRALEIFFAEIKKLEKRLNDSTKEEKNASHTSFNGRSIKKRLLHLYVKGFFNKIPEKSRVFEVHLVIKGDFLLERYAKQRKEVKFNISRS